jgi:hypothetical protein
METKSFQHLNPIWRDKANFIIGASVPPLEESPNTEVWEQLWARMIKSNKFEICCIPFFSYGLALGDEVETDQFFMIKRVSKKSGNTTLRIWFDEKLSAEQKDEFISNIGESKCLQEWYSENFLGLSSDSFRKTQLLIGLLEKYQTKGLISFEIGNP